MCCDIVEPLPIDRPFPRDAAPGARSSTCSIRSQMRTQYCGIYSLPRKLAEPRYELVLERRISSEQRLRLHWIALKLEEAKFRTAAITSDDTNNGEEQQNRTIVVAHHRAAKEAQRAIRAMVMVRREFREFGILILSKLKAYLFLSSFIDILFSICE